MHLINSSQTSIQRGYITLLTVLIITAVGMGLTISHLISAADTDTTIMVLQESAEALSYADACTELALLAIESTEGYQATETSTFAYGSCSYAVTAASATSTIATEGIAGRASRHFHTDASTEAITEGSTTVSRITSITRTEVAP
jgi:hypothetical protein